MEDRLKHRINRMYYRRIEANRCCPKSCSKKRYDPAIKSKRRSEIRAQANKRGDTY